MFFIYRSYPGSIAATLVSLLASCSLVMALGGLVVTIDGFMKASGSVETGLSLLIPGVVGFILLRIAAEKIAQNAANK